MRVSLLVIAGLLLLRPAAAHAELTSRVSLDAGGGRIGDRGMSWIGLGLGFERRVGAAAVAVAVSYVDLSDDRIDDWDGRMVRGAVTARILLADRRLDNLAMDAWLDVGAGAHAIEWDRGGVLYRPELLVGLSGKMGPDLGGGRFGDFASLHLVTSRGPGCLAGCPDELQLGIHATVGLFFSD